MANLFRWTERQREIRIDGAEYFEVAASGEEKKLETAQISLNDCLACSGCITSAESVLITMQSHKELYRAITDKATGKYVMSIDLFRSNHVRKP
jgi:iron only hydrogenase large subunit-like protein